MADNTPGTADASTATEERTATVVAVTEAARSMVLDIRANETDAEALGLRIEVVGANGAEYAYDLAFEPVAEAAPADSVVTVDGLTVIVPEDSVEKLRGATLDVPSAASQGGLVIRNPNRPDPLAGVTLELEGDLPTKVQQVLDQAVNPMLASHGGFATLHGVEDTRVFLSMGGGCQGCAVSAMTLREGIDAQLRAAIPEITEIIDITDHEAGENPYYR
ncbi:MAG TPA: NifU family protein [Acidimicrobiales bacterium]|nr:NifU family protein [Acidimicrobiales bacterium]